MKALEMESKLRVLDFFCGGGGFSEGFRQMGYEILYGYDSWSAGKVRGGLYRIGLHR